VSEATATVPATVNDSLTRLKDELVRAAGKNLAGLILYGGVARGRYRPGKSDINVVVLLHEISAAALAAIGPALRSARRAVNVVPMILTPTEVRPTAAVFPIKFLDIRDHHVVLFGDDPFAGLEVPTELVRQRVVQELRNLAFRLRLRFVGALEDRNAQQTTLANAARPLAVSLAALLRLAGKTPPTIDRTASIFQEAAAAFGIDGAPLAKAAALRQGDAVTDDLAGLFTHLFAALTQLINKAEQMKGTPA
jgi:hypothetical protein